MTYEDVKRIRENPTMADVDNEELARMIDEAIEKQIPKKPVRENNIFKCSICGGAVGTYDLSTRRVWLTKYCNECGQAIDWSDEQ